MDAWPGSPPQPGHATPSRGRPAQVLHPDVVVQSLFRAFWPGRMMALAIRAHPSGAYADAIMELRAAMKSGGLAWAALGLLDIPSSPRDLALKFQAEGAVVEPDRTSELLSEL